MTDILDWLAALFSMLFFVSSISKWHSLSEYYVSIHDFGLLSVRWIPYMGTAVVVAESSLAISFALWGNVTYLYGFSLLLLGSFTGLFAYAMITKKNVNCHCFGQSYRNTNIRLAMLRNMVLIALGLSGIYMSTNAFHLNLQRMLIIVGLVSLVVLYEQIKILRRNQGIKQMIRSMNQGLDKNLILLFLTIDEDKINMNAILHLQSTYPDLSMFIIYKGPEWKANVLRKRTENSIIIWVDDKGEQSKKMAVYRFPKYLLVNVNTGSILKTGVLMKEVDAA